MNPADVMTAARSWIDVPFHHQGRTRAGIDCVGLLYAVCAQLGLSLPAYAPNYARQPLQDLLPREMRARLREVTCQPGAVALISFRREPQHCGILTDSTIIHAFSPVGRVVEHGYRGFLKSKTVACFALPGVAYE